MTFATTASVISTCRPRLSSPGDLKDYIELIETLGALSKAVEG